MKWRINMEWAWQEKSSSGRSLLDCCYLVLGQLPPDPKTIELDDMICLTVDQMVEAEVLFKTGIRNVLQRAR